MSWSVYTKCISKDLVLGAIDDMDLPEDHRGAGYENTFDEGRKALILLFESENRGANENTEYVLGLSGHAHSYGTPDECISYQVYIARYPIKNVEE